MTDPEGEARFILQRAGFALDDKPGAAVIVRAILGARAVRKAPPSAIHGAEGELAEVEGQTRIYLSNRLGPTRAAFVALHELAHLHLGAREHGGPELEALCDAIAAALLCPRMAFRAAVCARGLDWAQLALDFGTSCSVVALRYGEVTGEPMALVAPRRVRVRGAEWTWPTERGIRRLARSGGPGLARTVLPDDERRVLLLAG